jgi:polyisoprenoid-binding protein YceI
VKTLLTIAVLSATVFATPLPTTAAEPVVRGLVSSRFTGSSTLHDFTGFAPQSALAVEPAADGSWTATVEVPVAALSTENASRDRKMREMFQAEEHPTLRAEFTHIVPEEVRASGRLPFQLTISGARRDVVSTVRDWRQTDDSVAFIAEFDVSLSAFGLEAPRQFVIVVADTVHVTAEVSLRPE